MLGIALRRFDSHAGYKRKIRVVNMFYFSGMTYEEIAEALNVSRSTVKNDWKFSKAWLLREIKKIRENE